MGQKPVENRMSEADLQNTIVEAARLGGWLVAHHPDSRRAISAGLPDLVMVHPDGTIAMWEIKTARGKLNSAQVVWQQALTRSACDYRVVRPADATVAVAWLLERRAI